MLMMKYRKRNSKMKKLLIIAAAPVLALSVTGAVLALKPDAEPKRVEVQQSASVETPEQTAPIQEETVTAQPQEQQPVEEQPTIDEIKASARQAVLADGQNEVAADCFVTTIDKRYGWANVTEESVLAKFTELDSIYVGMCPAYTTLKNRVNDYPGQWDRTVLGQDFVYPPGFRD